MFPVKICKDLKQQAGTCILERKDNSNRHACTGELLGYATA